jgi:hypothetical protein
MGFRHPDTDAEICISAPLVSDFGGLLRKIGLSSALDDGSESHSHTVASGEESLPLD